jgi:protein-disulfide isomerase
MDTSLNKILAFFLIPTVLIIAAFVYFSWNKERQTQELQNKPIVNTQDWYQGNKDAQVTVVSYEDLQCPGCKVYSEQILPQLSSKYSTNVKFVFKQFPLITIHQYAMKAAQASEYVGNKAGNEMFFTYLSKVFALQEQKKSPTDQNLIDIAKDLGVDVSTMQQDLLDQKYYPDVNADMKDGDKLKLQGTPSVFVNGVQVNNITVEAISAVIDQELAKLAPVPSAAEQAPVSTETSSSESTTTTSEQAQ